MVDPPTPTLAPTVTASVTASPLPTATATRVPSATPPPTATFEPAPAHDTATVESILRAEGYKRQPIAEDAWFWDNGSDVAFNTSPFGIEALFLNDPGDEAGRLKLIDKALEILAPLFTSKFIAAVREEAHNYAGRVITVSGDPEILDYGNGGSLGKLMQFNAYQTSAQDGPDLLPVEMSLLFREYKCPRGYRCRFSEMPSMAFTGGATLTLFDIWIGFRSKSTSPGAEVQG